VQLLSAQSNLSKPLKSGCSAAGLQHEFIKEGLQGERTDHSAKETEKATGPVIIR